MWPAWSIRRSPPRPARLLGPFAISDKDFVARQINFLGTQPQQTHPAKFPSGKPFPLYATTHLGL